jgi:hypothetical protein
VVLLVGAIRTTVYGQCDTEPENETIIDQGSLRTLVLYHSSRDAQFFDEIKDGIRQAR